MQAEFSNVVTGLRNVLPPDWPSGNSWVHFAVFTMIGIALVMSMVIVFIYIERRVFGRFQSRIGPNRTGPFGVFQAFADAVKVLLKENILPAKADKFIFWIAPVLVFAPTVMIFATVPLANGAVLADLNVGVLYIVAISSLSTVGVFMAGWSSSNKYSIIGAMRVIAAIISYEIPIIFSIAAIVLLAGSMSLNNIIIAQQNVPFLLIQPLGLLLMFIAGCAEINRSPFDLFEADSEIVAGFHIEYSGMKFAMFYLAEYAEAFVISSLITVLFLGGWQGPILPPPVWFLIKAVLVFFVMVWTRSTMPRVRIDHLMRFAWKFLLPLSVINLIITGIEIMVWPEWISTIIIPINFGIAIILILAFSGIQKRGLGRVETRQIR